MKYAHVLARVADEVWAIVPEKLHEILAVLAYRAAGHEFTPEELSSRLGDRQPAVRTPGGNIAVIPIRGTIAHRMSGMEQSSGGTSAEGIGQMLNAAMADATVGTVVFDVDSPGGSVSGISETAQQIFDARGRGKKIIAQVNSMAASAAYWLASQADEIVSMPSGVTGSIGVFSSHADVSAALEKEGVNVTLISAGKYKTEGSPFAPLSDEAKAFMQSRVDDAYQQFVTDVARGRGVSIAAVKGGYGQGRALTAPDALAAGLIDRIGTMDATLSALVGSSPAPMRADLQIEMDRAAGSATPDALKPLELAALPKADADADRLRRLSLV